MRRPMLAAVVAVTLTTCAAPAAYAQTQESVPDTSASGSSSGSEVGAAPDTGTAKSGDTAPQSGVTDTEGTDEGPADTGGTDEGPAETGDGEGGQGPAGTPDGGPADAPGGGSGDPQPNTPPVNNAPAGDAPVFYKNCKAVRDAGKAPILKGQPGYRDELDRDKDGKACDTPADESPTPPITSPDPTTAPTTAPTTNPWEGATRTDDYPVHGPNDGSSRFTSCRQFDSWRAAQAFYLEDRLAHARFDRDGDGIACEEYFTGDGRPKFRGAVDWGRCWWSHRRHTVHWDGTDGRDGRDGTDGRDGQDGADGRDGVDGQTIVLTDYITRYLDEGGDASRAKPGQQVAIYPSGGVDTGNAS